MDEQLLILSGTLQADDQHYLSRQDLFIRGTKRLIKIIINLIPSTVLIIEFKQVSYWWKQYKMAIEIYFGGIVIENKHDDWNVKVKHELQVIPLIVYDGMHFSTDWRRRETVAGWCSRKARIALFCQTFAPKLSIPIALQNVIFSYQTNI